MQSVTTINDIQSFQKAIWLFYEQYGRTFAWRQTNDPYHILVSEIMLQQTQTYRVAPKYEVFITAFADVYALAEADLRDVLGLWQGLGYNRRGKALWENAQRIVNEYNGQLPNDPAVLESFAHIGPNTARSICAFAFNRPVVFIETNIRTVYLHAFFKGQEGITDKQLMPIIQKTLDHDNPREWYYALMDYGVHLKKQLPNPSRKSAHHKKQSKFEGSDRQIRGAIIKKVVAAGALAKHDLFAQLGTEVDRYQNILDALHKEGMVSMLHDVVSV